MANFKDSHLRYLYCNSQQAKEWRQADFGQAQAIVAKNEGGYQAIASDKGNYVDGKLIGTNHGISAPVLKTYLGRTPTVADMKNLSYSTALSIYKNNYWNPIKGDQINSQKLAALIDDMSVNNGVGAAQKTVKDSLGISTYDVNKINSANADSLFNTIGAKREAGYKAQGGQFLTSWLNRLKNLGYTGVGMVKNNILTAILVALAIGGLITGIVIISKK